MASPKTITLLDSLVVSTNGVGLSVPIEPNRFIAKLIVEVALLAAPTTINVFIETGSAQTGWDVIATLNALVAANSYLLTAVGVKTRLRVRYEVIGSATLAVTGVTNQTFCETADIYALSLPPNALANVPPELMAEACLAATDEAVSYLGAFYVLALVSWGSALRMHTANMAAYHAVKRRGFNPDNDPTIRMGYTDAIKWLQGAARSDPSIIDSTPTEGAVSAFVISEAPRGWQFYR